MCDSVNMTLDQQVTRLIRPEIRALQAYPVADASGMIKLDAMENPYQWPEELVSDWQQRLADCDLNRYPHPTAPEVIAGLRQAMAIPDTYDVLLGNGSDEIIQLLAMAVAQPGATVLAPEPGFVMYKMIATYLGLRYVAVNLQADFSLDVEAMIAAINTQQPALIFLAQPNNPTGNLWAEDDLHAIIQASQGIVVIDEAYLPFSSRNHLSWLDRYEHVLVMRTLSKAGLAGLRLGLLIGRPAWLHEINKLRMPYNINVLTQASATFALQHYDVLQEQCELLRQQREWLMLELERLSLIVFPSEANFVLVRCPDHNARALFEHLQQHKILIKCLDGGHPLLDQCLRITVGKPLENRALIEALQAYRSV